MLMDQARMRQQAGGQSESPEVVGNDLGKEQGYKVPDWKSLTPPEAIDDVERVVAAAAKVMYAKGFRDELMQAVKADMPIDQKIADNVVGLLLMIDQKAKGGIPVAALFPAGVALMDEAAQVLGAAGQSVTQEDFDGATMRLFAIMAKKMGANDDDIMKSIGDAIPDDAGGEATTQPAAPDGDAEMAAMQEGMAQ